MTLVLFAGLGGLFSLVFLLLLVCHALERNTDRRLDRIARAARATSRDLPRRSAAHQHHHPS